MIASSSRIYLISLYSKVIFLHNLKKSPFITALQYIVVGEGEGDNNYEVVTLSNLHKLIFVGLPKFSSFWAGPSSNVLFTGKKVAFPCLEYLEIAGLAVEDIWDPTDPPVGIGKLRLLDVFGCDKLVRVINYSVLMRLQQHLESILIQRCGLLKEVFDVDDGIITSYCKGDNQHLVLFSRLKQLELSYNDSLKCIYNLSGSRDNKSVWSLMTTTFPNIEKLSVTNCDVLIYVLSLAPTAGAGFVDLREITVRDCKRIEAIVMMSGRMVDQETQPAAADAQKNYDNVLSFSYSSLKEMRINNCHQLRTFCQYLRSCKHYTAANDDLPFFSQKEIFPCLESLHLESLSKLGEIWPHEVPPQSSFKMLNKLTIENCAKLFVVFPLILIPRLENLTCLEVLSCDEMTQIVYGGFSGGGSSNNRVDDDESMKMMFTFPCLRELTLGRLPHLDRFYASSSACGFVFPSLEIINIKYCGRVKTIFGHDWSTYKGGALFRSCASQLATPNLDTIDLLGLEKLTKIWKGEKPQGLFLKMQTLDLKWWYGTNLESLLSIGVPPSLSCWNILKVLFLQHCNGLQYLFTPTGATSLVNLVILFIGSCNNIKEVFVPAKEAAATNNENEQGIISGGDHIPDMITFRHLIDLSLWNLPKLRKFSSVDNMVLNFPSLERLDIGKCPDMTNFSSGTATHKFGDLNSYCSIYLKR